MTLLGWAQIALVLALVVLCAIPLGRYLANVLDGRRNLLSPVLGPVERGIYAVAGVRPDVGMGWLTYTMALLMLSVLHFALLYLMLRFQDLLPLNPQGFSGMSPRLAFNTAISFLTNTNWQAYSGEQALSHGTQMWGLTVHNFLSAATGIAAAAAIIRGFARRGETLGNFWVDVTRITLYVLLPLSIVFALFLLISGVPETLAPSIEAHTLEGVKQVISLGPIAFQEAIKLLGTNGGGFLNANSAHPFENPTALTNVVEIVSLCVIPASLALAFGHMVGEARQGRALLWTMGVIVLVGVFVAYHAEASGNPLLTAAGVDPSMGNMEGKEVRFGTPLSVLFAVLTTGTSCGAVNAMHDSFMPLGGLVTLFMIQLGEITPGGVGSGLYGILVFALLAVFVAGLMVGRTPEYLGKKIQAREVKLAMLAVLILPLSILGGTAIGINTASGLGSLNNAGPHGLSEMLYAWTSATGNNGSAFAGISADTPLLDYGLSVAMILGRFAFLVPVMAIAGSVAAKPKLAPSAGTFPTTGPLFVGLLVGVIIILGGLQYLPALSLGPIAEHYSLLAGKTF
jgi:K+-transporting ATPase ATPase A chain